MAPRALIETVGPYRIVAAPNGAARYPVYVYALAAPDTPLFSDVLNLTSARAQTEFIARFPLEHRDLVEAPLRKLAAGVTAAQLGATPGAAEASEDDTTPWDEPVNGHLLVSEVLACLRRFLVLADFQLHTLALWVVHTYATDANHFTPYLWINSPARECGKTTLLDVLEHLVCNPFKTDGITGAGMFRLIEKTRPTLLMDELDAALKQPELAEGLRGVLNSGFKKGGVMVRLVERDGDYQPVKFSTFCAKVLAGIGSMPDTVASRSIPIRMSRASPDQRRRLQRVNGARIGADLLSLRRQLLRWATDARPALAEAEPDVPEQLGARQADIWRPLLAIADTIGGEWSKNARAAALTLHTSDDPTASVSLGERLLTDIHHVFEEKHCERITSKALAEELAEIEGSPWSEWRGPKGFNANALAKQVKPFGVEPKLLKIEGQPQRGYTLDAFAATFSAYLPVKSVTSVTSLPHNDLQVTKSVTSQTMVTLFESANSLRDKQVTPVTLFEGGFPRKSAWTVDL